MIAPNKVAFVYTGLDAKVRETVLTFHPAPDELSVGEAKYSISLAPFDSLLSVRIDIVRGRGRQRTNRRDPILSRVIAVAPGAACLRYSGGRRHRDVKYGVQRDRMPLSGRPSDTHDPNTGRQVPLRGNPLVFDHFRARWPYHGHAIALVRSNGGAWRAEPVGEAASR